MIIIPRNLMKKIYQHALDDYPSECCGALLGRLERPRAVEETAALKNIEKERAAYRYNISPRDLLLLEKNTRQTGREIVGYYHSHPNGLSIPSQTDRIKAWEGYSYLIVSVRQSRPPSSRSWRLDEETDFFIEEKVFERI